MSVRSVKISNVSLGATKQDIKEFFSFSGDIEFVEMKSDDESSQIAYVTFKDPQGAETAQLLSGATIVDRSVSIILAEDYQPPPAPVPAVSSSPPVENDGKTIGGAESALRKAEDVVTAMLARGFVLGKDVLNKAKEFDEKHQLTSTAAAKVASLDKKIGLSEKVTIGTAVVNEKVKEMDQKFQVSDKTKSAIATAEQKVSGAGSAILGNRFVVTGAAMISGAFRRVVRAAQDIGSKARGRFVGDQEQKSKDEDDVPLDKQLDSPKAKSIQEKSVQLHPSDDPEVVEANNMQEEFAQLQLSDNPKVAVVPTSEPEEQTTRKPST